MSTIGIGTSDEDLLTLPAAECLWRDDPDASLAGASLFSAETSAADDRSQWAAIVTLATDHTTRFLALVASLTPVLQDIFIQYYLLGRTYAQIGAVVFPGRTRVAQCILVKTGNRIGLRAMAALIRCGSVDRIMARGAASPFRKAWTEASQWQQRSRNRTAVLRYPKSLGDFVIVPNGQLAELFAPSWSVLGPSAQGGSEC